MNSIWLVRHGETEWTVSKQHTGRTDLPLTANGEEKARSLAPRLADHQFARVLSSPLQRARRTAALAGFHDPELDDRLMEFDYGDYEGRTSEEVQAERPDWSLWRDGAPGGESITQVGDRADSVIAEIDAVPGDVLLFGHGHFSRILAVRLLQLAPSEGRRLILGPGSISIVGSEHAARAIRIWNS